MGVSNFDLRQLEEARAALPRTELSSVQLDYSLVHRNVETGILPFCQREGIALLAYYPLGHGRLASDSRLDVVASRRGKTRGQTALRWLAHKSGVFPIPRASNREHVHENVGSGDWELTDEDVADLEAKFR